jgi:hypothetical protein
MYSGAPILRDEGKVHNLLRVLWGAPDGLVHADCQAIGGGERFSNDIGVSIHERGRLAERVRSFARFLYTFFGAHMLGVADKLVKELDEPNSPRFELYGAAYCEYEVQKAVTQWALHVTSSPSTHLFFITEDIDITTPCGVGKCLEILLSRVAGSMNGERRYKMVSSASAIVVRVQKGQTATHGSSKVAHVNKSAGASAVVPPAAAASSKTAAVAAHVPQSVASVHLCWPFLAHSLGAQAVDGQPWRECGNGASCSFRHPENVSSMDKKALLALVRKARMNKNVEGACMRAINSKAF